jgi:UBX domain-containing protein 1
LMRYDDPQSQAILESINRGQAPLSLFNVQRGQRADVKVAHRMQVDFVPPKPKPFSGSGHRLGRYFDIGFI